MVRIPTGKEVGRPKFPIEWEEVDKHLVAGCSGAQIAALLGYHYDTLYDRCFKEKKVLWSEYKLKNREKGNSLLHKAQFDLALKKDRTMLIWLGKQRLKQREDPSKSTDADILLTFSKLLELLKNGDKGKLADLFSHTDKLDIEKPQIGKDK